ncbi:hypothetical protein CJ739_628 [Mariniflexile rhizosphaerae]|nr:hypothetical protein [Mariniflexile sp. TRM1-10]AXP79725.1 hypothetical protein CJ739_628 [Mariniflexile sp. TRM1-10]
MTTEERICKELLHEPASTWFINGDFGAILSVCFKVKLNRIYMVS